MTREAPDVAAEQLRAAIAAAGGIANQAELARHWDVTRARAKQIVETPGFPTRVAKVGGSDVWAIAEVDAWRAGRLGPGRPPTEAAKSRAYLPGDVVPVSGQWTRYRLADGTSTGYNYPFERGDQFPHAEDGEAYSLAPVGGEPAVPTPLHRRR